MISTATTLAGQDAAPARDAALQLRAVALGQLFGGTAEITSGLAHAWNSVGVTVTLPSGLTFVVIQEWDDGWDTVTVFPPSEAVIEHKLREVEAVS